jgi:hypothetical protein
LQLIYLPAVIAVVLAESHNKEDQWANEVTHMDQLNCFLGIPSYIYGKLALEMLKKVGVRIFIYIIMKVTCVYNITSLEDCLIYDNNFGN